MKIFFVILLTFITQVPSICQSKLTNQWIFGGINGVVLDFNPKELEVTSYAQTFEMDATNASICDENGDLLFYTNGCDIFNKNFEIMENGDSISNEGVQYGLFCKSGGSLMNQSAMILPRPETEYEYVVIHNDFRSDNLDGKGFLYYSVVDMLGDNGLGEVTEKDNIIRLDSINWFGISATRHHNNVDWWIIFPLNQSNCYVKMLLSKEGVEYQNTECVGEIWTEPGPEGTTKFSPNGKSYAKILYQNGLSIASFDNLAGTFSDPVQINFDQEKEIYSTGVVFSENSRLVYALLENKVIQYDLHAQNIEKSGIVVASLETPQEIDLATRFYHAALGPDGKIYIGGTFSFNYLHVIHNPNCVGVKCDLEQYAIKLHDAGGISRNGMPNLPYFDTPNDSIVCDLIETSTNSFSEEMSIKLYPNPGSDNVIVEHLQNKSSNIIEFYNVANGKAYSYFLKSQKAHLNTSQLPDGLYFYSVFSEGICLSKGKFVKISYN